MYHDHIGDIPISHPTNECFDFLDYINLLFGPRNNAQPVVAKLCTTFFNATEFSLSTTKSNMHSKVSHAS